MSAFVQKCENDVHMYQQRQVHHIEQSHSSSAIWCYNAHTVWSAYKNFRLDGRSNKYSPAALQRHLSPNRIVSVQRNTKQLFHSDSSHKLPVTLEPDGSVLQLDANPEETVKAILTQEEDVLVQLLRSGNITYFTKHNKTLATMGLHTGPYVDIILAAEEGQFVHYFALSSKGKVYRVFLHRVDEYTCNCVEIPLQGDVPVVQIVCVQNTTRTPFYLVTRNAEKKLCMYRFTDRSLTFTSQTSKFATEVVVTHEQNVMLIPKTIQLLEPINERIGQVIDDEMVTTAFKGAIVAIVPSEHTGELKFCLMKQTFTRDDAHFGEHSFKITKSKIMTLYPSNIVRGFTSTT